MKMIVALAWTFFTTISVYAGWTSGGGETFKDAHNPWFLGNTQKVHYCIQHDHSLFGLSESVVREKIQKAIRVWKTQFEFLYENNYPIADVLKLGRQEFIETECEKNTDIHFQFGVLSGEQIRFLGDPTRYIGVTVRTDYNPVEMRGKGFIYVSPEEGPLKINLQGLVDKPWSTEAGGRLFYTLIHELGHVFGIQHTLSMMIMRESALEESLSKMNQTDFKWIEDSEIFYKFGFFKFRPHPSVLPLYSFCQSDATPVPAPPQEADSHLLDDPIAKSGRSKYLIHYKMKSQNAEKVGEFFNIANFNKSKFCFSVTTKVNSSGEVEMEYLWGDHVDSMVSIGTSIVQRNDSARETAPIIVLWIPKEQKVLDWLTPFSIIVLANIQERSFFKGNLVSRLNSPQNSIRPITMILTPDGKTQIGGILNGQLYFDIFEGF